MKGRDPPAHHRRQGKDPCPLHKIGWTPPSHIPIARGRAQTPAPHRRQPPDTCPRVHHRMKGTDPCPSQETKRDPCQCARCTGRGRDPCPLQEAAPSPLPVAGIKAEPPAHVPLAGGRALHALAEAFPVHPSPPCSAHFSTMPFCLRVRMPSRPTRLHGTESGPLLGQEGVRGQELRMWGSTISYKPYPGFSHPVSQCHIPASQCLPTGILGLTPTPSLWGKPPCFVRCQTETASNGEWRAWGVLCPQPAGAGLCHE